MKKILIIGPSIERTKGGIATVISSQLQNNILNRQFDLEHLISHVEGSIIERISLFCKTVKSLTVKKSIALAHIHVACDGSFYRKCILTYICDFKRIPVIMHVHGADFDDFFKKSNLISKIIIRATFNRCRKVLVLSEYWFHFFNQNIVCGDNVVVLANGVNVNAFKNCYTTTEAINEFLFLGRLGKRKGVYDLLEALNVIINHREIKNIKFYLAGDGDLNEVEAILSKYHLKQNVFLLGWLDDNKKHKSFKVTYSVVLPSYNEGLPMSLLEAMSCGKVIISTRVGGIPELVEEGENGFLIKPGDIEALIDRILYVLEHKEEMQSISLKNIEKINKKYNIEKINKQLADIYLAVLSNKQFS